MSGTSPACKGSCRAGPACVEAYPARMLKLRRTQESPEIVCIGGYRSICGMAVSRVVTDEGPRPPVERRRWRQAWSRVTFGGRAPKVP
jgi:hypothetical protein